MSIEKPPLIAVTMWSESRPNRAPRFAGSQAYFRAVEAAGGSPFGVPPLSEASVRAAYERADGLLLTGGGDVDPSHYGESPLPQLGIVDAERDAAELTLARWALEDNKPVLAICRGHQLLNVAAGGTLYQDIPSQVSGALNHQESTDRGVRGLPAHSLRLEPGSRLQRAVGGESHPVNTHHHQAVKDVARGLRVTGYSEDGIIESIESESLTWTVGIQCHPEEMWEEHDWAVRLFCAFVEHAAYAGHGPTVPPDIGALVRG